MVSPTTIANIPSAATKLMNPQCVRLHHANGNPASPSSGLLRVPHASTARPAGSASSMIAVAVLTAVIIGRNVISAAPST